MFESYESDRLSEEEPNWMGFDYDQVENMQREELQREQADQHQKKLKIYDDYDEN